jgi:hypothetical protein
MSTFYFNTGVKPNYPAPRGGKLFEGVWQIPFECNDVPEDAVFLYAANNPNLADNYENIICREIEGDKELLHSRYAYFMIKRVIG